MNKCTVVAANTSLSESGIGGPNLPLRNLHDDFGQNFIENIRG